MDVKQRIAEIAYDHGWNEWREECRSDLDGPDTYEHHLADMLVNDLAAAGLIIIEEAAIPPEHPALSILDDILNGFAKRLDGGI